MKKLPQLIDNHFLPAKLFLDDLQEIDKILQNSDLSYTLTIDEYELDSVHEIEQIQDKQDFNELKIRLNEPYLSLTINGYMTHIYSYGDTLSIGIIEKIKPIIRKRRKIHCFIQLGLIIVNLLLGVSNLLNIIENHDLYPELLQDIFAIIMIVLSIIIVTPIFDIDKNKFIAFTTKRYNEKSNYFIKNKDQLITNLIISVISIFIGGVGVTLFRFQLTGQ